MKNQVLSIEQMQELIELGIDTSNASVAWVGKPTIDKYALEWNTEYHQQMYSNKEWYIYIPTFTLQDILFYLPKAISINFNNRVNKYILELTLAGCQPGIYYYNYNYEESEGWVDIIDNNILEASFNMLKWCKQNNYI